MMLESRGSGSAPAALAEAIRLGNCTRRPHSGAARYHLAIGAAVAETLLQSCPVRAVTTAGFSGTFESSILAYLP